MYRTNCPYCDAVLFQDSSSFKCEECNVEFKASINNLRIEVSNLKRKYPSKKLKEQILNEQDHCCFWCNREFYVSYFRYNAIHSLSPNYDHIIPYSYLYSNSNENFVAACNVCNSFKSSLVFDNEDYCREYLKRKWDKHLRLGRIVFLEGQEGDLL